MIGAQDLEESVNFYVLGYVRHSSFVDSTTGKEGVVLAHPEGPTLLIVPFVEKRLPSPQHLALEVEEGAFRQIFKNCQNVGVKIRSLSSLQAPAGGPVEHEELGKRYEHYYLCDPSQMNIEIMTTPAGLRQAGTLGSSVTSEAKRRTSETLS